MWGRRKKLGRGRRRHKDLRAAQPARPGALAPVKSGAKLIAADAYGGKIAVIDVDHRTLALSHQSLRRLARTTFEDIHWVSLLGNHLPLIVIMKRNGMLL